VAKKKRKDVKYPNLDPDYNLKSRRDYMDNHYYVKKLKDSDKAFLDKFNKEYYNASFSERYEYDDIHVCLVDEDTVKSVKKAIRLLKERREKIYTKSPNKTTDEDREVAKAINLEIEEMENWLDRVHPRRERERANYARNTDLLNMSKASNMFDLVSWETLDDNQLLDATPEEMLEYIHEKKDKSKK